MAEGGWHRAQAKCIGRGRHGAAPGRLLRRRSEVGAPEHGRLALGPGCGGHEIRDGVDAGHLGSLDEGVEDRRHPRAAPRRLGAEVVSAPVSNL